MEEKNKRFILQKASSGVQQHEDAALKISMQFFADELLPYFGIEGRVVGFAPTELVHLDLQKLFQDFNLVMEDGTWKHFEFQSTDEGIRGLKRFRAYEALSSYQHKVAVTTYVLYSGRIQQPKTEFTEGVNTYRVIPIVMQNVSADKMMEELQRKMRVGEDITKQDLVPLTLCTLMGGDMPQKERVKTAYKIACQATRVPQEDIRKIEAVIYAMADKFLESMELEEIMEDISMTRLGQMLVNKGINEGINETKMETAKNLLDLLDEETIAERVGLPLETVQQLKKEAEEN